RAAYPLSLHDALPIFGSIGEAIELTPGAEERQSSDQEHAGDLLREKVPQHPVEQAYADTDYQADRGVEESRAADRKAGRVRRLSEDRQLRERPTKVPPQDVEGIPADRRDGIGDGHFGRRFTSDRHLTLAANLPIPETGSTL